MDIDLLSGFIAALSLAFAIWSWWSANRSRRAEWEAQRARDDAQRAVVAAEAQAGAASRTAEEMQKVAEELARDRGPLLDLVLVQARNHAVAVLRNRRDEPLTITRVQNREAFMRVDELEDGITLAPFEEQRVGLRQSRSNPLPDQLILEVQGHGTIRVSTAAVR